MVDRIAQKKHKHELARARKRKALHAENFAHTHGSLHRQYHGGGKGPRRGPEIWTLPHERTEAQTLKTQLAKGAMRIFGK